MRITAFLCALLCALADVQGVGAYEVATHGALSKRALDRSEWASGPGPLSIGLEDISNESFPSLESGRDTPAALIQLGSQHEDDGIRPINHFYDPYYDGGLWVPSAKASPDWALEDTTGLSSQDFSYRRLFDYFHFALSKASAAEREQYWGQLFEGMGHVVHHIQDMAQPQHVRNDSHYHKELLGDPSEYEFCTDRSVSNVPNGCGTPLLAPDYPAVALPRARDYWTTRSEDVHGARRGLADFTNANFVSKDTNFRLLDGHLVLRGADYPSPVPASSHTRTLEELGAADVCERLRKDPRVFGTAADCEIEFYATEIYDAYTGTSGTNERASSLSLFDQYLKLRPDGRSYETDRLFTLNRFNYAAAHPFLISRAIGYSAGLIDHFFRGRLELDRAVPDGDAIRIDLKNVSGGDNAFGPGTFELYYDSVSGDRKSLSIDSGADLGMGQFGPGGTHTLRVSIPEDVDLKVEKPFVLVYSGIVGAEEAVSGLVFSASEAYQGFLFRVYSSQVADRTGGGRLVYRKAGQWKLHPQGDLALVARVDWRGWYENGVPTRVLNWGGERYETYERPGPMVYENGAVLAVAPCGVRGAALQKDLAGESWVVVVCDEGEKDAVFKRPATRSESPALHDDSNPSGWRRLGEFASPPDLGTARSSWLFNGDGTEAQTMREGKRVYPYDPTPLSRLRVSVGESSAAFSNLGNTDVTLRETWRNVFDCGIDQPGVASNEYRREIEGEHVIAVDYVDDREVLARVRVDTDYQTRYAGQTNSEGFEGSFRSTETGSWLLEFGGLSVKLYDVQADNDDTYSQDDEWHNLRVRQESRAGTYILFMDLRSDVVITVEARRELKTERDMTDGYVTRNASWDKGRYLNSARDRGAVLFELETGASESQTDSSGPTGLHAPYGYSTLGYACAFAYDPTPPRDGHSELIFAATLATVPNTPMPPTGSFSYSSAAVDGTGNFFMSLIAYDGVKRRRHFINRLTGGNIDALTGFNFTGDFEPAYTQITAN